MRSYRWLLRLLPREFRAAYGADMELLLERRLAGASGARERAVIWLRAVIDVLHSALAERTTYAQERHLALEAPRIRRVSYASDFANDVRQAMRFFRGSPGYTATVLVTLAVSVGTVTSLYSVVSGVLLRPLPYPDAERLAFIGSPFLTADNLSDWVTAQPVAERVAPYSIRSVAASLPAGAVSMRIMPIGAGVLELAGAAPRAGRLFQHADHSSSAHPVALVSERFWREEFNAVPLSEQTLVLDGRAHTVVGILPEQFTIRYEDIDAWVPLESGDYAGASLLALLPEGMTPGEAERLLTPFAERMRTPDASAPLEGVRYDPVRVTGVDDWLIGFVRRTLWTLFGAAVVVLLLGCANVVTLTVGRALRRQDELAIRAALGAGRGRILRQLTAEALLMSMAGAALGLALAAFAPRLLALAPSILPRMHEVQLRLDVVAFAGACAVLGATLFGVLPGLIVSRWNERSQRQAMSRSRGAGAAQSAIVIAEIALALSLAIGAALLVRSYAGLRPAAPGFRIDDIAAAVVEMPRGEFDTVRVRTFASRLLGEARRLPEVEAAALVAHLPLTGMTALRDVMADTMTEPTLMHVRSASPGYLELMEMPIVAGRTLTATDDAGGPRVVVLNETAAGALFGHESRALGRSAELLGSSYTVVGIVRDAWIRRGPQPDAEIFVPFEQAPVRRFNVVMRTRDDIAPAFTAMRRAVARIDPAVPLREVTTMRDIAARSTAVPRFHAIVLGVVAATALLLAVVGCFAVLSQLLQRSTRDVMIRMALGASPARVTLHVVRRVIALGLAGGVLGIALAAAGTRVIEAQLFGVTATDPLTYAIATAAVLLLVLTTAWLPLRALQRRSVARALREG